MYSKHVVTVCFESKHTTETHLERVLESAGGEEASEALAVEFFSPALLLRLVCRVVILLLLVSA